MNTREAFAKTLKEIRQVKGLTQENFSDVSSRTYMSTLERELKSPTLDKIGELASVMKVHPLTLLAMTYIYAKRGESLESLLKKVKLEINNIKST